MKRNGEGEDYYGDFPEHVVPAGRYFVIGDHRDQSNDSRNPGIGSIPEASFIGRVVIAFDGPTFPWARLLP